MNTLHKVCCYLMPQTQVRFYLYKYPSFSVKKGLLLTILFGILVTGAYQYWALANEKSIQYNQQKVEGEIRMKLMQVPKTSSIENEALKNAFDALYFPWSYAFQILELSNNEAVTLLEVRQERSKHEIKVSAQATDLKSMFEYARKIKKTTHVKRVVLDTEEVQDDENQPIAFTLTIAWF